MTCDHCDDRAIRFRHPTQALVFWYRFGNMVRDFGMPCLMVTDEQAVDNTHRAWDYPDWFYVWCDLDKIIRSLEPKHQRVIYSYFKTVFHEVKGTFYRWEHRGAWPWVNKAVWARLPGGPDGLREEEKSQWKGEYSDRALQRQHPQD